MFENGKFFEDSWEGATAIAIVRIEEDTLNLVHLTILRNGRGRPDLGVTGNRRWLRQVFALARGQGFRRLVLKFDRLTGANPRKGRTRTFDL